MTEYFYVYDYLNRTVAKGKQSGGSDHMPRLYETYDGAYRAARHYAQSGSFLNRSRSSWMLVCRFSDHKSICMVRDDEKLGTIVVNYVSDEEFNQITKKG